MIQRIQTIYILLAIIAGIMTFILPFAHFYAGDVEIAEYAMFGAFNVQSDTFEMANPYPIPMWIMAALTLLMAVFALVTFKKRNVQMRLVRLGFLMNLSFIVYLFFAIDKVNTELYKGSMDILYHAGFYMPVIAVVFLFLAQRGIKSDEALVKSLDRLR